MTRGEAIDALKANYPDSCYELLREAVDMAIEALKEPKRKHGKWRVYEGQMTCLCCKTTFYTDMCEYIAGNVPKFCPRCGADMRG